MIKNIKKWLAEREAQSERDSYIRGYNVTAGALLKGVVLEEVESNIGAALNFGHYTQFDKGCEDAINKLEEIGFKFNRAD